MKIIALCGKGSSGKTTTINKLIIKVLSENADKIKVVKTSIQGSTIAEYIAEVNKYLIEAPIKEYVEDSYIVLELDGHLIGITTRGDTEWWLKESFKHFDGCELCFCAARSSGGTHTYIDKKAADDCLIKIKHARVEGFPENECKYFFNRANENSVDLLYKGFKHFLNLN